MRAGNCRNIFYTPICISYATDGAIIDHNGKKASCNVYFLCIATLQGAYVNRYNQDPCTAATLGRQQSIEKCYSRGDKEENKMDRRKGSTSHKD